MEERRRGKGGRKKTRGVKHKERGEEQRTRRGERREMGRKAVGGRWEGGGGGERTTFVSWFSLFSFYYHLLLFPLFRFHHLSLLFFLFHNVSFFFYFLLSDVA